MKVISIPQPWATLIVMGKKKIETRSWNTKYRGHLMIHASASKKAAQQFCEVPGTEPFINFIRHWTDLPFGAIIGQVNLIDTFPIRDNHSNLQGISPVGGGFWEFTERETAFGDYSPGRYGWLLSNPVQFGKPVPVRGKLRLWEYDLIDFLST
jgi:hypothetical protein